MNKFNSPSSVKRMNFGGRPRKTSTRDDMKIISLLTKNPFMSSEDIVKELDLNVHSSTVRRRAIENDLKIYKPSKKPLLNQTLVTKRNLIMENHDLQTNGGKANKRVNGSKCIIKTCLRRYRDTAEDGIPTKLFRFPVNKYMCRHWMVNCGVKRISVNSSVICNLHFEKKYLGINKLKAEAVPTLGLETPAHVLIQGDSLNISGYGLGRLYKPCGKSTADMNTGQDGATVVQVKQETDDGNVQDTDYTGQYEQTCYRMLLDPSKPGGMKYECQIESATGVGVEYVGCEPSEDPECIDQLKGAACDSSMELPGFVIYELEPAQPSKQELPKQQLPKQQLPKQQLSKQQLPKQQSLKQQAPPILLNTQLRKKARTEACVFDPQSITVSATSQWTQQKAATAPSTAPAAAPSKAPAAAPSKAPAAELKVKCFCRLGMPCDGPQNGAAADKELSQFFETKMNQTRRLPQAQQRAVKLALLEAVSQAEADAEAGRLCAKCCK